MKGYSDQILYLEEKMENMALLENGDLGQIVAFLKIQIAGVGHVSEEWQCWNVRHQTSILAGSARETAGSPQWEHSHTMLLWVPV